MACDNWNLLIRECEGLYDRTFTYSDGNEYLFFGLVHTDEDYYYGMKRRGTNEILLLSCVGDFETHGFNLNEA